MRKPVLVVPLIVAALAVMPSAAPAPADDAAIVHVLNRIGYGPRPSDLERVRQLGIQEYIEEQLHPERIADEGVQARLAGMTTLTLSTSELLERYQQPPCRRGGSASRRRPTARPERRRNGRCAIRTCSRQTSRSSSCRSRNCCARSTATGSWSRCSPTSGSTTSTSTRARARCGSCSPSTSARRSGRTSWAGSATSSARPRRARRCCSISTTG